MLVLSLKVDCVVCGSKRWYCRGCTRGLRGLTDVGYDEHFREKIWTIQITGCDQPYCPCIHCNRLGDIMPPDDMSDGLFYPEFWKYFPFYPVMPGQEWSYEDQQKIYQQRKENENKRRQKQKRKKMKNQKLEKKLKNKQTKNKRQINKQAMTSHKQQLEQAKKR